MESNTTFPFITKLVSEAREEIVRKNMPDILCGNTVLIPIGDADFYEGGALALHSFKEYYAIIREMINNGADDRIMEVRNTFMSIESFKLVDQEYVYPCYEACKDSIDYGYWFMSNLNPFDHIRDLLKSDFPIDIKLRAVHWMFTADLSPLLSKSDVKQKRRIATHTNEVMLTCINAYEYFNDLPSRDVKNNYTYSCEAHTKVKSTSDSLLRPREEVEKIMFTLHKGIVEMPGFPWEDVIIAGGSVAKAVDTYETSRLLLHSDIDIFIVASTSEECNAKYARLANWFSNLPYKAYFAVFSAVTTVYLEGIEQKFQIVSHLAPNADRLIAMFDYTPSQWYYTKKNGESSIYCTYGALASMFTRCAYYVRSSTNITRRSIKQMQTGFNLFIPSYQMFVGDDNALKDINSPAYKTIMGAEGTWFYPRVSAGELSEDIIANNISFIKKDSRALIVTTDKNKAIKYSRNDTVFVTSYGEKLAIDFVENEIITTEPVTTLVADVELETNHGRLLLGHTFIYTNSVRSRNVHMLTPADEKFHTAMTSLRDEVIPTIASRHITTLPINGAIVEISDSKISERRGRGGFNPGDRVSVGYYVSLSVLRNEVKVKFTVQKIKKLFYD